MATDTTNVTNATAGTELHEHDIDHAQLTQANAAPVVVQVPAGENVVRVQVTPGETIQLPFPIDAVVARLGDNGNLAVKVGDVTVILLGYAEATGQADVTILGTDARPMDVAAVLAATDPNLDIQTAAGPAAGPGAAGADNNGGVFAPFDPSAGLGGLDAVGGLNPTALNYNLIQRQTIEIIEDDAAPVVDNTPTILKIGAVLINEDDLPLRTSGGSQEEVESFGQQKILYSYEGNDKYDSDDNDDSDGDGSPEAGDGTGSNDDTDKEPVLQHVLIDVDFHGEVPGDLKLLKTGLPGEGGLPAWYSDAKLITWELSADGHTLVGSADGLPVIEIKVTNFDTAKMDGHFDVSVELLQPLDHLQPGESPDVQDFLATNVAFQVIDSNGSTVEAAFEATFEDDVPFDMGVIYSNYPDPQDESQSEPPYTANMIDEDDLKAGNGDSAPGDDDVNPNGLQSTARVEGFVHVQFGGDGPAAVDPFKFGVTDGADTGLKTSTGDTIKWHVVDAQHIEGVVDGQQTPAFTVELGLTFPAGFFLFQLNQALQHPSQDDPATQEIEIGFEDNLDIYIPVIATDNDGDSISTDIHVILDDDMPRIDTFDTDEGSYLYLTSDETVGGANNVDAGGYNPPSDGGTVENDEDFVTEPAALVGKYGDVIGGSSGYLSQVFSYNPGADGEKSHGYGLNVVGATTTIVDTLSQETVTLVQDDAGTVRGVVTIDGAEVTVFAVVVDDQTGEITFVQYRAVDHGADYSGETPISLPDEILALGSEHLQATFTVTDNDGDTVSSAADIGDRLIFEDDGPSINDDNASVSLDDDLLPNGNEGGEGDNDPDIGGLPLDGDGHPYVTGTLVHEYGSDGAGTTRLSGVTPPAGQWGMANSGTTITIWQNGHPVLEVKLDDTTSGKYTVTQLAPIMHPEGAEENDLQFTIHYRVTDGDGDFVDGSFAINIDDDTPVVTLTDEGAPSLTVDDTTLGTTDTGNFAGLFDFKAGADGAAGSPTYSFAFGGNVDTGVVDVESGHKVFLKLVDDHTLVGLVGDASDQYDPNGAVAFKITVDGSGNVTLEQMRAVEHDDPSDPDEASSPVQFTSSGLVYLIAGMEDNDGDTASNMVDISGSFHFRDDGPSVDTNELVRLDDDLLAGGNAEGTGDDDPDALPLDGQNHPYATGTLSHGFGADGAGTVLLGGFTNLGNLPAGSGFIFGGSGDGLQLYVKQTQGGVDVTVLTIDITNSATGAFKVTQLAAIHHPDGNNENNITFDILYKVTDKDGDWVPGNFSINVDDDTPKIADGGSTVFLDETPGLQQGDVDPATLPPAIATLFNGFGSTIAVGHSVAGDLSYNYGADGPGEIRLTSSNGNLLNGASSGFFRTSDGAEILLYTDPNNHALALGKVGDTVVMAVYLDDATKTLWAAQYDAIKHNDTSDPNDMDSSNSAIHLTVVDADGDKVTDIPSLVIQVFDDGPSATAKPRVTADAKLDESNGTGSGVDGINPATITAATIQGLFDAPSGGADGLASTAYKLSATDGAKTGLWLTGHSGAANEIVLVKISDTQFEGHEGTAAGTKAFTVVIDPATGAVTVTQNATLEHTTDGGPGAAHDDSLSLAAAAAIKVVQTVTDGDGDTASATSANGLNITFEDDGPKVSSNALVQLDDDALAGGNANGTGDNANAVNVTGILAHNYGADGAGTTLLAQATLPGVGGFTQTLSLDGKTLTILQNGTPVLKVELTNTTDGAYTVTQLAPISHPAGQDENNVQFTVNYTVTDGDGDTAGGTMIVDVDDDTPNELDPNGQAIVNIAGGSVSEHLGSQPGADGFGQLFFTATDGSIATKSDGTTQLKSGGQLIYLYKSVDGSILYGTTDADGPTGGLDQSKTVFKVTLDSATDTYKFELIKKIDDGSGVSFTDLTTVKAGQNDSLIIFGSDVDPRDLLLSPTNAGGTINTNNGGIGNSNNMFDAGEGVRMDFVLNANQGTTTTANSTHFAISSFRFGVHSVVGGGDGADFRIRLFNWNDATDVGAAVAVSSIIVTLNGVDLNIAAVPVVGQPGVFEIYDVPAGALVTVGSNSAFNQAEVLYADDPGDNGQDYRLGSIEVLDTVTGNAFDMHLGVNITDKDGDTASPAGAIDISVLPSHDVDQGIQGGPLNDILHGGGGNDTMSGGGGDDIFIGGTGNDTINLSDGGSDTIRMTSKLDGHDVVSGFDATGPAASHDHVDLDALFDSMSIATASRAAKVTIEAGNLDGATAADTVINVDTDGVAGVSAGDVKITLLNVTHTNVTLNDDITVGTM